LLKWSSGRAGAAPNTHPAIGGATKLMMLSVQKNNYLSTNSAFTITIPLTNLTEKIKIYSEANFPII
jgi:hypothetical protein